MEDTPKFSTPEGNDDEEEGGVSSKPSNKEIIRGDETREQTVRRIVQSVFGSSKEGVKSGAREQASGGEESQPEDVAESRLSGESESVADLTPEQEVYVNRSLAEEHLEHPVTEGQPMPPVNDFLHRVVEGEQPSGAYESTIRDNDLGYTGEEHEPTVQGHTQIEREYASEQQQTPQYETPIRPVAEPLHQRARNYSEVASVSESESPVSTASAETTAPTSEDSSSREAGRSSASGPSFTSELAGHVAGQRHRSNKSHESTSSKRKNIEQRVVEMEADLKEQEDSIQKRSLEKRVRDRITSPKERIQPGRQESRLGLNKPEKAEHIGKMLVDSERAIKDEKRLEKERRVDTKERRKIRPFYPEDVRTMRREDLVRISARIRVGGASLKNMFENHLFGEGALRRLVEAHLKGQELTPLLRREILEKQLDYERDPLLRDRDRRSKDISASLLERMVSDDTSEIVQPNKNAGELPRPAAASSPQKEVPHQVMDFGLMGVSISVIIVLLIGLIIYLIFRR